MAMTVDALGVLHRAAGQKIVRPRTEVRPGVVIGMVEDSDGNWVEFIQAP